MRYETGKMLASPVAKNLRISARLSSALTGLVSQSLSFGEIRSEIFVKMNSKSVKSCKFGPCDSYEKNSYQKTCVFS